MVIKPFVPRMWCIPSTQCVVSGCRSQWCLDLDDGEHRGENDYYSLFFVANGNFGRSFISYPDVLIHCNE